MLKKIKFRSFEGILLNNKTLIAEPEKNKAIALFLFVNRIKIKKDGFEKSIFLKKTFVRIKVLPARM